ncbi:hypothetical protein [Microbacterium sp. BK668]|uniref:hypothetical protein n=1 Tax=Microbacterium sp. BK668 TaxID=2512118 RepID=UPI00105F1B24|nr:hypothetical protein [Microbacterium sp. BK668]TDN87731.1 hypothetical protein EV279_3159 [Microbacterium sp. BK668]
MSEGGDAERRSAGRLERSGYIVAEPFVTTEQLVDDDPQGFLSAIRTLQDDRWRRDAEPVTPEVIDYRAEADDEAVDLVLPGTATLFLAERGSEWLEEVRSAYAAADRDAIASLTKRSVESMKSRERVSFRQAARDLTQRPYGDLRYRGRTLAECVGLANDIEFGVLPLIYAGGDLDDSAFSFVQYLTSERQAGRLEAVIVKRPRELTEIERQVLERKKKKIDEILARDEVLIAPGGQVAVTVTTITIALFVVAVHTPTLTGGMDDIVARRKFARLSRLADDQVAALGRAPSVGDLIDARLKVMSSLY